MTNTLCTEEDVLKLKLEKALEPNGLKFSTQRDFQRSGGGLEKKADCVHRWFSTQRRNFQPLLNLAQSVNGMTYRDFKLVQSFSHWRVQNSLPESPKLLISSLISQSSNLSDSKIAVPGASIKPIEEQQLFIQFIGYL